MGGPLLNERGLLCVQAACTSVLLLLLVLVGFGGFLFGLLLITLLVDVGSEGTVGSVSDQSMSRAGAAHPSKYLTAT